MSRDTDKITVVFDIDDTICRIESGELEEIQERHPECHVTSVDMWDEPPLHHVFIPYFDKLLQYLLNQGCRVEFFSLGSPRRNMELIWSYLLDKSILGPEQYISLAASGQFTIFSGDETQFGKKRLVRSGRKTNVESIILVDDRCENAASIAGEEAMIQTPAGLWIKNHTYYLLGYFMTFFQRPDKTQSLRAFVSDLDQILNCEMPWVPQAVGDFTLLGLQYIRQMHPECQYYRLSDECRRVSFAQQPWADCSQPLIDLLLLNEPVDKCDDTKLLPAAVVQDIRCSMLYSAMKFLYKATVDEDCVPDDVEQTLIISLLMLEVFHCLHYCDSSLV